jgi:hypothetical protein
MLVIQVAKQIIQSNLKHNQNNPPISVRNGRGGKNTYCHKVIGPDFAVVHDPVNPLPCGAKVWIEFSGDPSKISLEGEGKFTRGKVCELV